MVPSPDPMQNSLRKAFQEIVTIWNGSKNHVPLFGFIPNNNTPSSFRNNCKFKLGGGNYWLLSGKGVKPNSFQFLN